MAVAIPAIASQIEMITVDQQGTKYQTNLNKSFGYPRTYTYNYVDTAARSIAGLSTNTYNDSIVVMSKSVNEALAEDE